MNKFQEYFIQHFFRVTVFGLVGRSGTGKSYHSKQVAERHKIGLIIDDGLLIKGDKILAGHSAKQDQNFMAAVKTAVFEDEDHRAKVAAALQKDKSRRILVIGTSEKMVMKIAARLDLPEPQKFIHIEDIATAEEIETAMHIRFTEGKHVIPVPSIEITRSASQIVYDSIRVKLKGKGYRKNTTSEKTIVRPEFSRPATDALSETVLTQMVKHAISEYNSVMKVKKVKGSRNIDSTYSIQVVLQLPLRHYLSTSISDLQQYIRDCLEKFGNILVKSVSVEIEEWG